MRPILVRDRHDPDVFHSAFDLLSQPPEAYLIVFALALGDAVVPVLPSEAALITAGLLSVVGDLTLGWVIAAGALGAYCGDGISYALGRFVGRPFQERFLTGSAYGARARLVGASARGARRLSPRRRPVRAGRPHRRDVHLRHHALPVPTVRRVRRARGTVVGGVRVGARLLRRTVLREPRVGRAARRVRHRRRADARGRRCQAAAPPVNRLANETSPYLLQHAANPVDWYPWGDEALTRARVENRPILLSIGYAACHWCHVMERESFEDARPRA